MIELKNKIYLKYLCYLYYQQWQCSARNVHFVSQSNHIQYNDISDNDKDNNNNIFGKIRFLISYATTQSKITRFYGLYLNFDILKYN